MKKRIVLRRILHRERWRYGIFFDFDKPLLELVKKVEGVTFSNSNKCWYVDDNENNLKQILAVFRDQADIDISEISINQREMKAVTENTSIPDNCSVTDQTSLPSILAVDADHGKTDFQSISATGKGDKDQWKRYGAVEFTISEPDDRLIIRFTGRHDNDWIRELKSYGRASFDPVRLEWLLDWSRLKVDSLSDYFSSKGVEVIVKRVELSPLVREQRVEQGSEIRERQLSREAMKGMENVRRFLNEKRYSRNTVEAYLSLLELFFKFFYEVDPAEITKDDISDFFTDYITFNNYSASYHNQLISAIKIYYNLNGSRSIDSSSLGRPRRSRALPKVFSKEEVKRILNSARNVKHKLLLWLIYSCGLRRSEVTGIKIRDLDRDRGILNIKEAKGMTDRIVPVPEMVWTKIDEYKESYRPVTWLFEGQTGGRYSSESVYRVFKQALQSAGIKKDVGVHSLRHSYATHLHENGLDIRYIQELLGHRSTRTTEIYTHVSRRNLILVRSPIEDLGLK